MKQLFLGLCCVSFLYSSAYAQKTETLDVATYTIPKGWQSKPVGSAIQLSVSGPKGTCAIVVFKAVPAGADSRANFTSSWDTMVKATVPSAGKLEMQPTAKENGWTLETGIASYDAKSKKGVALLLTGTSNDKLVRLLILTDTDAYEPEISAFIKAFHLAKVAADDKVAQPAVPAPSGKFQFMTTNFDDGWTATEQPDGVMVKKGNLSALVHYPNPKADAYNSVLRAGLQNAWNLLVAPRYSNIRNFELKPIQSFESIAFAEADAQEKATGKTVHVVLFKKHFSKGNGRYIEFVTSSKAEFEKAFGAYHNDEFGWDKLVSMQGKNRFAVGASDLVGKWATRDYASLSYYYVNGGGYAGATATSTADLFTFKPGSTYQSDHSGASGVVGSQKFSRQVYQGKYTTNTWTITLTNRFRGESEKYSCYFEAVKGGRILILTDRLRLKASSLG
ncbi:MAG: hypothetical protein NTX57_20410 [Armatimonadetes bacterium]|nr:hypothetical protein [Armatimonadota bacterium]